MVSAAGACVGVAEEMHFSWGWAGSAWRRAVSVVGAGLGPARREALRGLGIGQGLPAGREGWRQLGAQEWW